MWEDEIINFIYKSKNLNFCLIYEYLICRSIVEYVCIYVRIYYKIRSGNFGFRGGGESRGRRKVLRRLIWA